MFNKTGELPPAFEEALTLTKCAFAEWKKIAAEDGFSLLVVAEERVENPNGMGQIKRLKTMLDELDLPLLNLRPEFSKRGDLSAARWKFDGHWTPIGHRWAADAIFDYLSAPRAARSRTRSTSPSFAPSNRGVYALVIECSKLCLPEPEPTC